ncbi:MAG: zinc ribbon domain-containing protein [Methanobrevibacter sp.]
MVKHCPQCNTETNDDSRFCPKCGYHYKFEEPQYRKIQVKAVQCPQCHSRIDNLSYGFCPKCGFEFQTKKDNITYNYLEVVEKSQHQNSITYGYILAILIPIVGVFFAIYNISRKGDAEARSAGINQLIISLVFLSLDISYLYFFIKAGAINLNRFKTF